MSDTKEREFYASASRQSNRGYESQNSYAAAADYAMFSAARTRHPERMEIIIALLLASSTVEVHHRVDAAGVHHFGDVPGPETAVLVVEDPPSLETIRAAGPSKATAPKPPRVTRSGTPSDRLRARHAEKCHLARQRLRQVENRRRAGYTAAQDRPLREARSRHQADVRFYCK